MPVITRISPGKVSQAITVDIDRPHIFRVGQTVVIRVSTYGQHGTIFTPGHDAVPVESILPTGFHQDPERCEFDLIYRIRGFVGFATTFASSGGLLRTIFYTQLVLTPDFQQQVHCAITVEIKHACIWHIVLIDVRRAPL